MTEQPPWVVVMSKPSAEEVAERSLRQAGYRVYLPRYRKILHGVRLEGHRRIRTRGPGEIVMRPAMPRYLFGQIRMTDDDYHRALRCRGVDTFLRMRAIAPPACVSDAAIERLRSDEDAGKFDEPRCRRGKDVSRPDLEEMLEDGDPVNVRIEIGGLAFVATLEALDKSDRAVVSYMLFGRVMETSVEAHTLEVVTT